MTASSAPSARPPYAVLAWIEDDGVYLELPGAPPYILRFPLSEAGLQKALETMRGTRKKLSPLPEVKEKTAPVPHPKLRKAPPSVNASPEARAKTRDILRKLKII